MLIPRTDSPENRLLCLMIEHEITKKAGKEAQAMLELSNRIADSMPNFSAFCKKMADDIIESAHDSINPTEHILVDLSINSKEKEMKNGIALIAEERINVEGLDVDEGQLAIAGAIYAMPNHLREASRWDPAAPKHWPFSLAHWKPTPEDRIKQLVKAGALIAAEIDRLQQEEKNV